MSVTLTTPTSGLTPQCVVEQGAPSAWLLPVVSLAQRELVRFLRQRTRIVGALGQPLMFWVLFGAGLQSSFRGPGGATYQEYFFAGVAVMIVLFTAIFSTITVIEDRREGFLQGVLASPVPRSAIVVGKLTGGTMLAVGQTLLFLLLGPLLSFVGLAPELSTGLTWQNVIPVVGWLVLLGYALTGLGLLIAWPLDSTHGFHAIMSVFLLPMWLLSGAVFPADKAGWLSWLIAANPLTYGVAGLRRLLATDPAQVEHLPSGMMCLVVMLTFCGGCAMAATWLASRPTVHNIR